MQTARAPNRGSAGYDYSAPGLALAWAGRHLHRFRAYAGDRIPGRALHGQLPPEIQAAQRLQEAGAYAAAADTLRPYLQRFPDDAGTRWLFGRLLYWSGEYAEARGAYEAVLAHMPEDPWLELEYAQLLMAMEEWREAGELLRQEAAGEPPGAATEAEALLGTLAYRGGDLTEAVEGFQWVLDRRPTHAEAGRQLREIRSFTRPWTRVTLGLLDDDRPYRRYQGALEGGAHFTPLWSLAAGADPRILDSGRRQGGGDGWGQIRGYLPDLRLHLSARGGRTVQGDESSWIGGAELGLGLPGDITLAASAGRTRYLWTLSSADTLVMVSTAEIRLDRADAPGWAGEAALRREDFADDNRATTAYAWILAPLVRNSSGFGLRLGYAFSWADARESRWRARRGAFLRLAWPHLALAGVYALTLGWTLYRRLVLTPESALVLSAEAVWGMMGFASMALLMVSGGIVVAWEARKLPRGKPWDEVKTEKV